MSSETSTAGNMFRDFVQIGVVVHDLDRTVRNLAEIFNIGPFRTIEWPPSDLGDFEKFYHESPGDFTARMAFTELGPLELEIIQPLTGKSIWADFLEQHGEGIHHIRFNVLDEEPVIEYLAKRDIQPIQSGSGLRPGTLWVNFGTEEMVGFIIEVMRAVPGTDGRTPQF
jgi:methylmalonyl-CoA/ethylmalonyl-CoA epimerase